jgi:hypothetical protein
MEQVLHQCSSVLLMSFISEFFEGIAQFTVWTSVNICEIPYLEVGSYSSPEIHFPPQKSDRPICWLAEALKGQCHKIFAAGFLW